jgi:hypothetical protein
MICEMPNFLIEFFNYLQGHNLAIKCVFAPLMPLLVIFSFIIPIILLLILLVIIRYWLLVIIFGNFEYKNKKQYILYSILRILFIPTPFYLIIFCFFYSVFPDFYHAIFWIIVSFLSVMTYLILLGYPLYSILLRRINEKGN